MLIRQECKHELMRILSTKKSITIAMRKPTTVKLLMMEPRTKKMRLLLQVECIRMVIRKPTTVKLLMTSLIMS